MDGKNHPPTSGTVGSPIAIWRPKRRGLGLGLAYVPEELITDDLARARLSGCSAFLASVWKVHISITRTAMCRPR